jgi:hypothetical protein
VGIAVMAFANPSVEFAGRQPTRADTSAHGRRRTAQTMRSRGCLWRLPPALRPKCGAFAARRFVVGVLICRVPSVDARGAAIDKDGNWTAYGSAVRERRGGPSGAVRLSQCSSRSEHG